MLLPRCIGILTYYFCAIDTLRRYTTWWDTKSGQFICSGMAATTAFWIVWPFELLKNLAQAENKDFGKDNWSRAKFIFKNQGFKGFYRGIVAGS